MSWNKSVLPMLTMIPALAVSVTLIGCSGSPTGNSDGEYPTEVVTNTTSDGSAGASSKTFESTSDMISESDAALYDEEPTEVAEQDVTPPEGESEAPASMIRRTAQIDLESDKYDEANASLSELIKKYSIVTLSDSQTKSGYSHTYRSRNVRFRIKSEQFDEFCDAIEGGEAVWDVNGMDKGADDVTKQYSDNTQRIEALRTRYDWYRQQLEKTDDESIAMEYSDKMFDTLDQIKALENTNKLLETDVAYSIIEVSLTEDTTMSEPVEKSDNIWKEVGDEFLLLPNRLLNALGMFVLFLIHMLPGILILAIILLIAWLIHKGYRKAHPKRQRQVPIPQNAYAQQQPANYPQNPGANRPPVPYPVSTATQPPASPVDLAPSQAPIANGGTAERTAGNDATSAGDRKTGHDEEPLWRSYDYYDPIIKSTDDDDPLVELYGPAVIETEADAKAWGMPRLIPNEDAPDDPYDSEVTENGETGTIDPTKDNETTDEGRDLKEFLDEMGIEERTSRAKAKHASEATDANSVYDGSDDVDEEPPADPRTQNMDIWSNVPDATYLSTDENDGDAKTK